MWRAPALVVVGFISGTFGFWVADRGVPIDIISAKALADHHVFPGGDLEIEVEVYRHHVCSTNFDRVLKDATGRRYALADDFISPPVRLGRETYISVVKIPVGFSTGPAEYHFGAAYYCNPLHRFWPVLSRQVEVNFNVEPPPAAKEP